MSIRDSGTVEKVQRKLERVISFEKYSLKFWKKKNYRNIWKNLRNFSHIILKFTDFVKIF